MSTQKTWNRLFIISFNMELNPLLTLPDLTEPFCRFQLNIQQTACCFELHGLGWFWVDFYGGYSSFQTAKLVNT